MNKIYKTPKMRIIDLVEEGMIAASPTMKMDQNVKVDQLSNEKDLWGNEDIWK